MSQLAERGMHSVTVYDPMEQLVTWLYVVPISCTNNLQSGTALTDKGRIKYWQFTCLRRFRCSEMKEKEAAQPNDFLIQTQTGVTQNLPFEYLRFAMHDSSSCTAKSTTA